MPPKKRKASTPTSDDEHDELYDNESGASSWVPGQLAEPVTGYLSAIDLYQMIKSQQIDLNPDFQRDFVWPRPKQIGLLLSLAQNYPIPPLYFSIDYHPSGAEFRSTLDGKQRLTTLYEFFEGKIPYVPEGSKARFWYCNDDGKKKTLMTSAQKRTFEDKTLTCVQYSELSKLQERDMFQRVQLGMPLKEGEKLQSLYGNWPAFCSDLVKTYVENDDGLRDLLNWNTSRGVGFQIIASIACYLSQPGEDLKHRGYQQLHKFLTTTKSPPSEAFKANMRLILSNLTVLASTSSYNYPFKSEGSLAPIEITTICLLLARMRGKGLNEMAVAIQGMRQHVREHHVDVRANSRVFATLWEYCLRYEPEAPLDQASGSRKKRARGSK